MNLIQLLMKKMNKLTFDKTTLCILTGVIGGLILVFISLVESKLNPETSQNVVALVNGRPIDRVVFDTMFSRLNNERKGLNQSFVDKATVLERMIEEELLVQRGVELGLPYSDKITRGYLIQNMINLVTKEASNLTPDDSTLEAFYQKNKALFTQADRLSVAFIYIKGINDNSLEKANQIKTLWISDEVRVPAGDPSPIPLPKGYHSLKKLADYIGTEYTESLASLPIGGVSQPFPYLNGLLIGKVTGKRHTQAPEYNIIKKQALMAYRKEKADVKMKEYLKQLKLSSEIEIYDSP